MTINKHPLVAVPKIILKGFKISSNNATSLEKGDGGDDFDEKKIMNDGNMIVVVVVMVITMMMIAAAAVATCCHTIQMQRVMVQVMCKKKRQ